MSGLQITKARSVDSQKKKSRRVLLLVLVVFIVPVVLAKLALEQHWFSYGVTNKGKLLNAGITLEKMGLASDKFNEKWLMLYLLPKECLQQCQQTLHSVNNTFVALGKEMGRVKPVALTYHRLSNAQTKQIQRDKWLIKTMPEQTKQLFTQTQVLIADPLGNVILSYQLPNNTESLPLFGKALLADFKKLLKYSRIG